MNGFQERNPNFRVFNAVLHLDEATPHLHIDYIPVGHYKQGVDTQNGIAQVLKEMGYGIGKDAISRWREAECKILTEICKAHNIEIAAPEKSRGSLTVEQYKEYAQIKELTDEKKKEAAALENKVANTEYVLGQRQELLAGVEKVIDKLDAEYQVKNAAVEQLDNEIIEKENIKARAEAVLTEKQALLEKAIDKVVKINCIDHIETGKTVFCGKVTVAPENYDILKDLAKKQIAAESKEGELTAEVTKLKKENEELTAKNQNLQEQAQAARSLKFSLSNLQRELDTWKQKYNRVMEFIESLNLKERLEKFLHPVTHIKKGR